MTELVAPLTVIYHSPCADGHTACWVARKFVNEIGIQKDVIYHPTNYGTQPPDVSGRQVIIVDFSYPRELLLDLHAKALDLIVLDHHKTAQKDLEGLDFCTFDMHRSGAGLAWDYFFPDRQRHWLINYVEDRDLWNWKLPKSREVSAALDSFTQTFEVWDEISNYTPEYMASEGVGILRYESRTVESISKDAREVELGGHKVLAVNSASVHSALGNRLAEGRPFGVVWRQKSDGKFVYSLRSKENGLDVSEIAKSFGGGGHRSASSFTSDKLLF